MIPPFQFFSGIVLRLIVELEIRGTLLNRSEPEVLSRKSVGDCHREMSRESSCAGRDFLRAIFPCATGFIIGAGLIPSLGVGSIFCSGERAIDSPAGAGLTLSLAEYLIIKMMPIMMMIEAAIAAACQSRGRGLSAMGLDRAASRVFAKEGAR
jgi:hypothetical protein